MDKIQVIPWNKDDRIGYDIRIVDFRATIEDYHKGISEFIIQDVQKRYRKEVYDCEGCNICCQERIPLTYIDVLMLMKEFDFPGNINDFLRRYGYIVVEGNLVDIALARDFRQECIFLRKEDQRCEIYQQRPLVCRTYICVPLSPRAKELRSQLVNTGMDILINKWLSCGEIDIHEAIDPDLELDEWSNFQWPSTNYGKIIIKDVVSEGLFNKLLV